MTIQRQITYFETCLVSHGTHTHTHIVYKKSNIHIYILFLYIQMFIKFYFTFSVYQLMFRRKEFGTIYKGIVIINVMGLWTTEFHGSG
jgi:hypothetical protein